MIIDLTKFVYIWVTNNHKPKKLEDSNIAKIVKHISLGHTVTLILTDNVPNKEEIKEVLSEFDYTGRIKILSYETNIRDQLINLDIPPVELNEEATIFNKNIATFLSFINAELTHEKGAAIAAADMIRLLLRVAKIEGVYVDFDTALLLSSNILKSIDIDFIITSAVMSEKHDEILLNINNDILYLPHDLENNCRKKILETIQNQETKSYNYETLINNRPNQDQHPDHWLLHIGMHSGPGIIAELVKEYLVVQDESLLRSAKLSANKCNIVFPLNHISENLKPTFDQIEIPELTQILSRLLYTTSSEDSNSITLETYNKVTKYLLSKPEIDTNHIEQLQNAISLTPFGIISKLVNHNEPNTPSFPVLRGTGHTSSPSDSDNFERSLYRASSDVAVTEDLSLQDEVNNARETLKTVNSNDRPEDNGEKSNESTNNAAESNNKSTSHSTYYTEKNPHNDIKEEENNNDQPSILIATKPIDDNIIGCITQDDDGDDDSSKLPAYAALNDENKVKVESVYLDQKVSEVQAKFNSHLEYKCDLLIANQDSKKKKFDTHPLYEYAKKCNITVKLQAHPNDDGDTFVGNANIEILLHDNAADISVIGKTVPPG